MQKTVRAALYLDFDNVFSGLMKLDPRLAIRFAEDPSTWVSGLANTLLTDGPRRWLVLRCYMNPSGSVLNPDGDGARLWFSRYRLPFTDAGFEVVDCPRLTHTKNGADIRLALDSMETLSADVRYDEFVIASGDSDMTPLLVRLRAADRRVTVLSPSDSADVLGAIADRLIGGEELLELLQVDPAEEDALQPLASDVMAAAIRAQEDAVAEVLMDPDEAQARFESLIRERYANATEPLNLGTLAHQVRLELGAVTSNSRWFGHGSFPRAVQALDLPDAHMSHPYLWDSSKHEPPIENASTTQTFDAPSAVRRVSDELRLPRLKREAWWPICESLAAFVAAYDFNLTAATRWSRDRLVKDGVEVNRKAVTVVAQGASYGGCPLYRKPPPTAVEIAEAFTGNVLDRAAAADLEMSDEDATTVRSWFGSAPADWDQVS